METTARNRTIGGIVIGAIILILLLVLFSCTVNGDPKSSPEKDPSTGESSLPSEQDTLEPDEKPSESESADDEADEDDIVPAANTGVTFIPAGNVPSGSTPTCELDPSACEGKRPPGAGVDICEIRPDLTQCQPPTPPTTPPGEEEPPTEPEEPTEPPVDCALAPWLPWCDDDGDDDDDGEQPGPVDKTKPKCTTPPVVTSKSDLLGLKLSYEAEWGAATDNSNSVEYLVVVDGGEVTRTSQTSYTAVLPLSADEFSVVAVDPSGNRDNCGSVALNDDEAPEMGPVECEVVSSTELKLTWGDATDDSGRIHHYTATNDQGKQAADHTENSATYTGLQPGTNYSFGVTATDWSANESESSRVEECATEADGENPTTPRGLKAGNFTTTTADLSWNASKDDSGVDHYEVSWAPEGGGLGGGSDTTEDVNYYVEGMSSGTTYTFTVTAVDVVDKKSEPATDSGATRTRDGAAAADEPTKRSKVPSKNPVEVPSGEPTEENSPLLPPLGDVLGGDKADEAPAEEPEAEPSESESPAERPTTEEPAEEKDAPAEEEEDEGGLLDGIVGGLTAAVAAVF